MKADRSGTRTEQVRHRVNWRSRTLVPPPPRCRDCKHVDISFEDRFPKDLERFRCKANDFATTPGAVCDLFEPLFKRAP